MGENYKDKAEFNRHFAVNLTVKIYFSKLSNNLNAFLDPYFKKRIVNCEISKLKEQSLDR